VVEFALHIHVHANEFHDIGETSETQNTFTRPFTHTLLHRRLLRVRKHKEFVGET